VKRVVSNASPLIILAKADLLELLLMGTLSVVARSARRSGLGSFDEMTARIRDAGIYLDEKLIHEVRKGLKE